MREHYKLTVTVELFPNLLGTTMATPQGPMGTTLKAEQNAWVSASTGKSKEAFFVFTKHVLWRKGEIIEC